MFLKRVPAAPPMAEEVRSVRESFGWTREQMADEMAVLPLEVAAWEAGTLAPTREQAAVLRWRVEMQAHGRRAEAAGLEPCPWFEANGERLGLALGNPDTFAGAQWEIRMHERKCSPCLRREAWLRDNPAPLLEGPATSLLGRIILAPGLLWEAARYLSLALVAGVVTAVPAFYGFRDGEGFHPSATLFFVLFIAMAALKAVAGPTRALMDERPFLGAHLRALGVVLPLLAFFVLSGVADLATPAPWIAALCATLLFGTGFWVTDVSGTFEERK